MALTWPLVKTGSTGEDVKTVQYLATAHGHATGVDGVFGPQTKTAVQAFQQSQGLAADGEVGNQTWPKLLVEVSVGSQGDAVKAVQSQIHGRGDGAHLAVDGTFGPDTDNAVRVFQDDLGLALDGIVGPDTWNHLVNGYLAAPDPQTAARDVFSAWEAHDRDAAGRNATPAAVSVLFGQSFSPSDGWTFEGCGGALGHTFCTWQRSNGHQLRIGVENAVSGPYYVADQAEFV